MPRSPAIFARPEQLDRAEQGLASLQPAVPAASPAVMRPLESLGAAAARLPAGAAVLETSLGASNVGVGQFSSFVPGKAPTRGAPTGTASAVTQAIVTALQAAPLPLNTPVVVASAAAAAVAVVRARAAQAAAAANPGNAELQAAAEAAARRAETAIQSAVAEAQAVLQTAIQNGAIVPTPPAPPPAPGTSSLLQRVEDAMRSTPPPLTCTGSPC